MTELVAENPQERFQNFLKSEKYRQRLAQMAIKGSTSIIVDFEDLLIADQPLAEAIIEKPDEYLDYVNRAAYDQLRIEDPIYAEKIRDVGVKVRFRGLPHVTPMRSLGSEHVGKLIMVEGIIVRATTVQPLVVNAVFKCRRCETKITIPQSGAFLTFPIRCSNPQCGRAGPFDFIQEESEFVDSQRIRIQEYPEELPPGQTPRSLDIQLVGKDIVDIVRPGDRVYVVGIIRAEAPSYPRMGKLRAFNLEIEANYVESVGKESEALLISPEEEKEIIKLSKDPWIHRKIIRSIAPSIYGYEHIKEAIMYLLFGGVPKQLPDITIRGEINILLIGDPGTAKSQILRYVQRIAPRGLYTSGRGTTAAGLTAAVLPSKTGGMTLEAGALVLADKGIACLHPDALIFTSNGPVRIGEIGRKAFWRKVSSKKGKFEISPVNLKVASLTHDGSIRWANATIIRRKKYDGYLIRIKLRSGFEAVLTEDHLLLDRFNRWKPAGRFQIKEAVVAPLILPDTEDEGFIWDILPDNCEVHLTNEELQELKILVESKSGRLRGTSNIPDMYRQIRRQHKKEGNSIKLGDLKRICRVLGIEDLWRMRMHRYDGVTLPPRLDENLGYLIGLAKGRKETGNGKRQVLSHYIGEKLENLPTAPKRFIYGFLRGLEDSFRNRIKGKEEPKGNVIFSGDREACLNLILALRRIGVYSHYKSGEGVIIDNLREKIGLTDQKTRLWDKFDAATWTERSFTIEGRLTASSVNNEVPVEDSLLTDGGERTDLTYRRREYFLDEIVDVRRERYRGWVYDLYVPGNHNFTADGIIVHNCIDEIDKMRPEDRVAIHEAMEQHTISVAKGGIVATLNARAAILAAANPALGRYEPYRTVAENISLPVTILSRFDLIFVLRDVPDKEHDSKMTEHILNLHMKGISPSEQPIPPDLLRKYISYARTINPVLTPEAMERLKEFYLAMRSASETEGSPIAITARQLESLIRLAEARARAALRDRILAEDAEAAIAMMRRSLEEVGIDVSSHKIDIDIIMTGKPKSVRDKLRIILGALVEMEKETGIVEKAALLERLEEEYDLSREESERLIKQLIREGTVYEPRRGYLKKVT